MINNIKIYLILIGVSLTACAGGSQGPDEFGVLPTTPLQYPKNLSELPEPNLSGQNLADKRPIDDVINALGGNADLQKKSKIKKNEKPLLKAVSRFGITPDIRMITASEDADFREKNKAKVLERLVGVNTYKIRYRSQRLDAERELERLNKLGIRTPIAPSS